MERSHKIVCYFVEQFFFSSLSQILYASICFCMFESEHYLPLTWDWFRTAGGYQAKKAKKNYSSPLPVLRYSCSSRWGSPEVFPGRMGFKNSPPVNSASNQGFPPSWTCCKSSKQYSLEAAAKLLQFLIASKNAQHPLGGIASSLIFSVTSQAHDDSTVDLIAADVAPLHLLISHSLRPHSFNKTPEYFHYLVNLSPLQEVIHYSQAESHVLKLGDTPFFIPSTLHHLAVCSVSVCAG